MGKQFLLLVPDCPGGASTLLGILAAFSKSGEAKGPKEPALVPEAHRSSGSTLSSGPDSQAIFPVAAKVRLLCPGGSWYDHLSAGALPAVRVPMHSVSPDRQSSREEPDRRGSSR